MPVVSYPKVASAPTAVVGRPTSDAAAAPLVAPRTGTLAGRTVASARTAGGLRVGRVHAWRHPARERARWQWPSLAGLLPPPNSHFRARSCPLRRAAEYARADEATSAGSQAVVDQQRTA